MPRPRNKVENEKIEELKRLVFQTFGKVLTHSFECEMLSRDIKRLTGGYVSPQTLRRLFGFLDSSFSPSVKTLNVVAGYAGFDHWHAFTESVAKTYEPLTLDQEADLYLHFYKIDIKAEGDMNYHNASRNFALRILFNPALLSKLSPALARNPVSQVYFFERFPYIDGLCTGYRRSIQLYLQKKTPDAQVFGNSMLFLSAFLGGRQKELKNYAERIAAVPLTNGMHPFIVARHLGSLLLYETARGGNTAPLLAEAGRWNQYFLQKSSASFWYYPYFQHMMADYLNLAGLFSESCKVVRTIRQMNREYEIEQGYREALEVISQVAGSAVSPEAYINWFETTRVFDSINPLFKKFYELQALSAYCSAGPAVRKAKKAAAKMDLLIAQTGFTCFLRKE